MSKIEWTEKTWNPVTGCDKISPGCKYCYAERMAIRLAGRFGYPKDRPFAVTLHPDRLIQPHEWKNPKMVFVNSMSDLFHPDIPFDFLHEIWSVMSVVNRHTYQILTKRPDDMIQREIFGVIKVLDNVWLGTSIENQEYLWRMEHLKETPAAVRFISFEPLLDSVGEIDLSDIHWVIVGGESGPRARPMNPDWVREIRDQCIEQKVPFFFKQWGGVRKNNFGRELDGKIYDEYPV